MAALPNSTVMGPGADRPVCCSERTSESHAKSARYCRVSAGVVVEGHSGSCKSDDKASAFAVSLSETASTAIEKLLAMGVATSQSRCGEHLFQFPSVMVDCFHIQVWPVEVFFNVTVSPVKVAFEPNIYYCPHKFGG